MKVKIVLATALVLCGSVLASGQQTESFDIITYASPKGWQKEAGQNALQFGIEDRNGNSCLIMMFKPLPGGGDPKANFDAAWETVVKEAVMVRDKPQMQPASKENGWSIESGLAKFESDGNS
ncbi:MAG: hypothetical protein J5I65_02455, partial [Aridibacter famidurans]|nr:hypothetical protein [Aridibacter famidurans]